MSCCIVITIHCISNGSNTPAYVLADYLTDCLAAFDKAAIARDKHFVYNPS